MPQSLPASLILCGFIAVPAVAQDHPVPESELVPPPGWDTIFLTGGGATMTWRRPDDVDHVIISGCGGGSSGSVAAGVSIGPGIAAVVTTLIIPVTANTYTITVGNGGQPKQPEGGVVYIPGEPTIFDGKDIKISFQGGGTIDTGSLVTGSSVSVFGAAAKSDPGAPDAAPPPAKHFCVGGSSPVYLPPQLNYSYGGSGQAGFFALYPLEDARRIKNLARALDPDASSPESQAVAEPPADAPQDQDGEGQQAVQ